MAAATLPTAGSPTLVKTAPVKTAPAKPATTTDEMITPPSLRRFLKIPVRQIDQDEILMPLKRQYRVERFDRDEIDSWMKQNENAPIWLCRDGKYFTVVDGHKRLSRARYKSMKRECHCKPATIPARILDLTPKEAAEIMDAVDTRENALFAFGQEDILPDGAIETLTTEHFAYIFAKRRVQGRIGYSDAPLLDELLGDPDTNWDEEELWSGHAEDALKALQWWLETLSDVFGTSTAMASADPLTGKSHPLQTALLEESKGVFAKYVPAIEEHVRLCWLLENDDAYERAKNVDYSFPCAVALMRAYREFATHAADAVCAIFPKIDRKLLSLII